MANVNTPKPWERQPKETPKPFEAFCIYRDMGTERSIRKVAEKLGKSNTIISRWSTNNNWVERVAAWDDEQERIEREEAQKEHLHTIREMRKRQAGSGFAMQFKALEALKKIPLEDLSGNDIVRLLVEGAKMERIGRGDVGDVVEERNGGEAVSPVQIYIPDNNRGRDKDTFEDLEV